jgi:hypothetical protein
VCILKTRPSGELFSFFVSPTSVSTPRLAPPCSFEKALEPVFAPAGFEGLLWVFFFFDGEPFCDSVPPSLFTWDRKSSMSLFCLWMIRCCSCTWSRRLNFDFASSSYFFFHESRGLSACFAAALRRNPPNTFFIYIFKARQPNGKMQPNPSQTLEKWGLFFVVLHHYHY